MADKVAVLLGGNSAERAVSLKSGEAVLRGLKAAGINALPFDPAEQPLQQLHEQGFNKVFIALHGRGGEDGVVQGALEWLGLPYTGSRVLGSALAMDKVRTKQIWAQSGLPTAGWQIVDAPLTEEQAAVLLSELGGKVMVKPACEGSSIGMACAETATALQQAVTLALEHDQQILVEAWINGAEFTVAILDDEVLPAIRMETPHAFYDYEAKYRSNSTQYHCPCGLSDEQEAQLQTLAKQAFDTVGASGWARVDAMQTDNGEFMLLEVNTVPGMTEKSLVPMAAKAAGIRFEQLVSRILQNAR